jgi:hypothetical protein
MSKVTVDDDHGNQEIIVDPCRTEGLNGITTVCSEGKLLLNNYVCDCPKEPGFAVYGTEERATTYLRLEQNRPGVVYLVACDQHGVVKHRGYILGIDAEGQLILCGNVNETIGLQLDGDCRLKRR